MYSNCLIEAIKAKVRDPKAVRIIYLPKKWNNGVRHFMWVKNDKVYQTLFLSILVSCSIEFAQSVIGRTADIDDVIRSAVEARLNAKRHVVNENWEKIVKEAMDKKPKAPNENRAREEKVAILKELAES